MTQATFATAKLFRDRDFFIHDGSHLRRLRLSAPVQMGMLVATLLLLCWSVFVTARLIFAPAPIAPSATSISGDIARLAAATEARVAQIEQRQQVLAAMLSGAKVDPAVIAKLGYTIPADGKLMAQGGPFDAATKADPTFKSLFTSWKKLDNITDSAIAVPSDKPVKTAEFTSGYGIRSDPFQGRAAEVLDIVDLAAVEQSEADFVDHQADPVGFGDRVALLQLAQFELVAESGAAAAVHRKPKHRRLALLAGDEGDALGGAWREGQAGHTGDVGAQGPCGNLSASRWPGRPVRPRPSNECRRHSSAWRGDSRWTS